MNAAPDASPNHSSAQPMEVLRIVRELVAESRGGRAPEVSLDSQLERELGLDSLARVELAARIERALGLQLPEAAMAEAQTVGDLVAALRAETPGPSVPTAEARAQVSGETAVEPPEQASTLVEMLLWHAERQPQRAHIRFYKQDAEAAAMTYADLLAGARAIAAGLQKRRLAPGQAVAIMLPTGLEFFHSFFGALLAGGVPVPIYPPTRATQIEDHLRRQAGILQSCLAPILITADEARTAARLLAGPVDSLREVASVKEIRDAGTDPAPFAPRAGDLALLQYTSGSTGNPKGVMLTHANLLANIRAWSRAIAVGPTDVCVSWLPLYHDMGLIGTWLGSLYNGNALILMSPLDFLARPARWLWTMHRHRGTISAAPNFAFELALKRLEHTDLAGLDLSSWRMAINGAEPVSPDTLENFCARFAPYGFRREAMTPMYGLAENAVGLTVPPPGRGPRIDVIDRDRFAAEARAIPVSPDDTRVLRVVACGRALPEHEIRIVDEGGTELPERRVGRIEFRGPSATAGYFRNADDTRRLRRGEWLDTGDLGYLAEGELFVTGRIKDMIIRGGRNFYPYELEQAIGDLPGVRKGCVAVFGVADRETAGERLVAVVESKLREEAPRAALVLRINGLAVDVLGLPLDDVVLAAPRSVLKTSSGKIRRAATRDVYLAGTLGAEWSVRAQLLRVLWSGLAGRLRRRWRQAADAMWAGWTWICFFLLAIPVWAAVSALRQPALGWRIGRLGARALARITGIRLEVQGLEHLPPTTSCVVVANHASYLDGLVAVAALPRPFAFVAKQELTGQFAARMFLTGLGAEFVERFAVQDSIEAARRLAGRAQAGTSLFFFPEGTFGVRPGLAAFRMGAFLTAVDAQLPVVPIAIRGTRAVLTGDLWFPHCGSITLTVHPPIAPGGSDWAAALALRDAARAAILRECGETDLLA